MVSAQQCSKILITSSSYLLLYISAFAYVIFLFPHSGVPLIHLTNPSLNLKMFFPLEASLFITTWISYSSLLTQHYTFLLPLHRLILLPGYITNFLSHGKFSYFSSFHSGVIFFWSNSCLRYRLKCSFLSVPQLFCVSLITLYCHHLVS